MVSLTFDPVVKALHVRMMEGEPIDDTVPIGEGKYMYISATGKIIGLEVTFPSSTPQEAIDAIINSEQIGTIELLNRT